MDQREVKRVGYIIVSHGPGFVRRFEHQFVQSSLRAMKVGRTRVGVDLSLSAQGGRLLQQPVGGNVTSAAFATSARAPP
jgi:F0F1-type ATP synthase gamma subunit